MEGDFSVCPIPTININCFSFHSQHTSLPIETKTRIDKRFNRMFWIMSFVFTMIVYHVGHLVTCRFMRHTAIIIPTDVMIVTLALFATVLLIGVYMICVYIHASEDPWEYFFFRSMAIIWYDVGVVVMLVVITASYSRHSSTIEAWAHRIYGVGVGVLVMYLIVSCVTSSSTSTSTSTAASDSTHTASTASPIC